MRDNAWGQRFYAIEAIYEAVPEDQHAGITEALLSKRPAEEIATVLYRAGHRVSPSTIKSYRRAMRQNTEGSR